MINEANATAGKAKGRAYLQLNMARKGTAAAAYVKFINNEERYHWCSVTHLG